ncbi:RHS repeat-associated core domain-containing protein [Zobellia sp. OII3]|uniref:RHS repeat-associated core domain-containing protein n=1 Tax=Zobellia sp. OII3 TaxID=2034520 RepID=UPI00191B97CD|nr:RHS repeat-associated core domain-containing protein [Zobellia sp. OII3]
MPGRNIVGDYRYGYQGQEKDPETGKEAFELRLWDSRIGRWLTTDPYGQHASPYMGMGNSPIARIDPDGGYDSWLGAFFGWVGGGFKGNIGGDSDRGYFVATLDESGELGNGISFNYGTDGIGRQRQALVDQLQFENMINDIGGTVTYTDSRLEALSSHAQFTMPSARFNGLFNVFSKTPDQVLLNKIPTTINDAGQARHVIGHGLRTPIKQNSAASLLTESADKLLKTVHSKGYKSIERINDSRTRVVFDEIIGLHKTQPGTVGTPTNTAILHYGKKGAHFVPATPR